jgi:hypothetical protein
MVATAQPPITPPSSGISKRGSPFSPPETATTAKYVTPPANAPANTTVRPCRAKRIPAQLLVNRREEGEATVGPDSTGDELVDGPRPALGLDDEPEMEREVWGSGEDRSIAADLLREHLAPLGPEVALDEQRDRSVADPDAGERVRSQEPTEEQAAGS